MKPPHLGVCTAPSSSPLPSWSLTMAWGGYLAHLSARQSGNSQDILASFSTSYNVPAGSFSCHPFPPALSHSCSLLVLRGTRRRRRESESRLLQLGCPCIGGMISVWATDRQSCRSVHGPQPPRRLRIVSPGVVNRDRSSDCKSLPRWCLQVHRQH